MSDLVAFEGTLIVEVELLQCLSCWEAGAADAALPAVGFAGGDLAVQAGRQELPMGPVLGAGPLTETSDRISQRRRFECAGEEREFGGDVPTGCGGASARHEAASWSVEKIRS